MTDNHYLRQELYELARENDSLLDFMQAGSLDGMWFWDLENPEHEWMSPRFWETFGYDPSQREHLASEWQDMIHSEDLQIALENFNAHCADPSHPYDQYVRYRHRLGHWSWVRCRGYAIRDDTGKPVRMLGVHVDVTELKQSEERQEKLLLQTKQINEELELFAYAASHDLQSPIKSLKGLMEILKDELSEEGSSPEETIQRIDSSITKMQSLVDSVLLLSGIQREMPSTELVELKPLIDALLRELSPPESATINLLDVTSVRAHPSLLSRALRNLISNSILYASPDRPLVLSVEQKERDGFHEIIVSDNGIGIPEGDEEKIVRSFYKGESGGHGLGLAIVKRVMQTHDGELSVERLAQGTRFKLIFPKITE